MRHRLALVVLCWGGASLLGAQTTGKIVGRLSDPLGSAAPGAVVSVDGPRLQGTATVTTDARGEFRFTLLPPGVYRLTARLAGFTTIERTDVRVGIDRTVSLDLRLEMAALAKTVQVTGDAPAVDLASNTSGVHADADVFERLPFQRDFYALARITPGTQEDRVGTGFYGSTGAENAYVIDGLNVTGGRWGDKSKILNFDFVEEVEIKSGGLPAEYGRTTGGVVSVLTKSGGNEFHGSAFGFFEGGVLQSDDRTADERPATTTEVTNVAPRYDFGAELGGYLLKDRVWLFGAYDRVSQTEDVTVIRELVAPGAPGIGEVVPKDTRRDLFAAKLTWRITPAHRLSASVFGDPTTEEGRIRAIQGPASTFSGFIDSGATDAALRYEGLIGSSFLVVALYGRHVEGFELGGPGVDTPQRRDLTVVPAVRSGGLGFFSNQRITRDVYRLDLARFFGSHELRLGGDLEAMTSRFEQALSGTVGVSKFAQAGLTYYSHGFLVDDRAPSFDSDDPGTWVPAPSVVSSPRTRNFSAYLQDGWRIVPRLTLNAGLRWERQLLEDRFGRTVIRLDNWAPRIGLAWAPRADGRSKLYAYFGRLFESIPMNVQARSFGGEVSCASYNFDPSPGAVSPDPAAPRRSTCSGAHVTPVAPGLRGQYVDEWLGGYEREVAAGFVIGVKGTYRRLGRVIEDFLIPAEGQYFIANPGEGLGDTVSFYDYTTAPAPRAERSAYGIELTARRRFLDDWQLLASYAWSRLEGNYDGLYQTSTDQLDPNINSAFDYADFQVNAEGRLASERVHQIKLDGSYQFDRVGSGLTVGLSARWYSGLPLNAYGYSFAYASWEYFLVPRGSVGRGPADYEVDLHLSYPVKLGRRARLHLALDVFNLLDRQAIRAPDQRFNLAQDGACAGVPEGFCNGDGGLRAEPGTLQPVGSVGDPRQTATNPDYLRKGTGFTGQRSLRLGVRLGF